uniref:Putative secreted protein n=1 Tax=Ixodes ricinus TaxID=34613 RepID=A0A6B0V508_IXORI
MSLGLRWVLPVILAVHAIVDPMLLWNELFRSIGHWLGDSHSVISNAVVHRRRLVSMVQTTVILMPKHRYASPFPRVWSGPTRISWIWRLPALLGNGGLVRVLRGSCPSVDKLEQLSSSVTLAINWHRSQALLPISLHGPPFVRSPVRCSSVTRAIRNRAFLRGSRPSRIPRSYGRSKVWRHRRVPSCRRARTGNVGIRRRSITLHRCGPAVELLRYPRLRWMLNEVWR